MHRIWEVSYDFVARLNVRLSKTSESSIVCPCAQSPAQPCRSSRGLRRASRTRRRQAAACAGPSDVAAAQSAKPQSCRAGWAN
jgi:hypothetical protein